RGWARVSALLLLTELLEPVQRTVFAGQVDVLLMALVVLDVLVKTPRWPRGLLIGLAAAVKLTPAVFLLYFLLRRDNRAALTAGLSFVAVTVFGFLVAPVDSMRYWTSAVFDSGRVGGPSYAGDQSLTGVLARLGVPASERTVLWLVLAMVTIALTVLHAPRPRGRPRHHRAGAQRRVRPAHLTDLLDTPLGLGRGRPARLGRTRAADAPAPTSRGGSLRHG